MKLELLKKKEMPLLSRTRYTYMAKVADATPSRILYRDAVASDSKADPSLVVIKHIYTKYGKRENKIIAHVYDKDEDLVKYEHEKLVAKHKEKPKEAEGEKPAEGEKAGEEKPSAPEQKEEVKKEAEPSAAKEAEKKEEKPAEAKEEKK